MTPAEIRIFEELTVNTSGALKQMMYDGWVLRSSPSSKVKRANSVTALYPSTQPIDDKLDFCETFYASENSVPRFRIHEFSELENLDQRLATRGYEKIEPTLLMTLALENKENEPTTSDGEQLSLEDWLEINHALRGNAKETIDAHRTRLQSIPLPFTPIALFNNGDPVCIGFGMQQGNHFGLFDIFTPNTQRNHGYATLVTCRLLTAAWRQQARIAFLQVEETNVVARKIYERLGFRSLYRYWYRVKRVE
ncbi:MAG TPA: GNAT family N-acetyltransferase [Burkholderiales bacterium]|nr:GNAT family N-acetyltransferase [Burkholderiales bacterium]